MSERIETQIERFAPGFRERVLARHSVNALDTERHKPNYVGGDINCGAATLRQTVFRPRPSLHPYRTPMPWRLPVLLLHPTRRRRARHAGMRRRELR